MANESMITWTEDENGTFITTGATITITGRKPRRWRFKAEVGAAKASGNTATLTDAKTLCEAVLGMGR